MNYHKYPHPANFRFFERKEPVDSNRAGAGNRYVAADCQADISIESLGEDVFRLTVSAERWRVQHSQAELDFNFGAPGAGRIEIDNSAELRIIAGNGFELLRSARGQGFGVCGNAWVFCFEHVADMRFYGMGQKSFPFERSGVRTRFWNTDVWADFAKDLYASGNTDPMYISIPYLIVKRDNRFLGILINSAESVFMATMASPDPTTAQQANKRPRSEFFFGAPEGQPELFFLIGPSLAELTQKLQRLCGPTPLPPLWALGHHQSRWGYAGSADLELLDQRFSQHAFPCDGLWLDIDYMREYRVFTFEPSAFVEPQRQIKALRARGRHVVPILDPGVKVDDQYAIDRDGVRLGIFCLNSNGDPYVGLVWPGATHFPDFSQQETRSWWAEHVCELAEKGISGVWIDMNDPSTGAIELTEMRFQQGALAHERYHNQYALGMAKATREGLLANDPERRPFVLSRSAFISSSRYTAVWTGDNYSNAHHLSQSIPMLLNLSLSGLPFCGADVPGFGGDASEALAIAWYKAAFLQPFFRNHSAVHTRPQEPWTYGDQALQILRHYARLRYKLLPYLYNLFIDQEKHGAAVMRPLLYEFNDSEQLQLDRIDDQFMVGPNLMQAPVLESTEQNRLVTLPPTRWYGLFDGRWHDGGCIQNMHADWTSTLLFAREGALVPMRSDTPVTAHTDLSSIDCHCFLWTGFTGSARLHYRFDDGETFAYRGGERSILWLEVQTRKNGLDITITRADMNYLPMRIRFVLYDRFGHVQLLKDGAATTLPLRTHLWQATGATLRTWITPWTEIA